MFTESVPYNIDKVFPTENLSQSESTEHRTVRTPQTPNMSYILNKSVFITTMETETKLAL